jgi:hypothetical protein
MGGHRRWAAFRSLLVLLRGRSWAPQQGGPLLIAWRLRQRATCAKRSLATRDGRTTHSRWCRCAVLVDTQAPIAPPLHGQIPRHPTAPSGGPREFCIPDKSDPRNLLTTQQVVLDVAALLPRRGVRSPPTTAHGAGQVRSGCRTHTPQGVGDAPHGRSDPSMRWHFGCSSLPSCGAATHHSRGVGVAHQGRRGHPERGRRGANTPAGYSAPSRATGADASISSLRATRPRRVPRAG